MLQNVVAVVYVLEWYAVCFALCFTFLSFIPVHKNGCVIKY